MNLNELKAGLNLSSKEFIVAEIITRLKISKEVAKQGLCQLEELGFRIDQEFNQGEGPDDRSFNNERRTGCARLLHGGSFTERRVASVWSPLVYHEQ